MNLFANQFHLDAPQGGGFLLFLFVVGFILWLITLTGLLKRDDLKDVDKIVWTIVLCSLNILGMFLYWFLSPQEKGVKAIRSEQELKDYCNSRADSPEE